MKKSKIILSLLGLAALVFTIVSDSAAAGASLAVGPMVMGMEDYANQNFSSFEGDGYIYTGEGDHFLNFGGNSVNFANEGSAGRQFTMTITNGTANNHTVTLIPGYTWKPGDTSDATKVVFDGTMFTDGSANTITGSGSPSTIKEFLSYLEKNPTNLVGMKVSSNNSSSQVDQNLTVSDLSPFRTLENRIFALSQYTDQDTYRDKTVKFATPGVILGPETEMTLPVIANSVLTVVFYCGGTISQSSALKSKRNLAVSQIANRGVSQVRKEMIARPVINTVHNANPLLG